MIEKVKKCPTDINPLTAIIRLMQIIKNSISSNTIEKSVEELRKITSETAQIGNDLFMK